MKTRQLKTLRFAGLGTIVVLVFSIGLFARSWISSSGKSILPAAQPAQLVATNLIAKPNQQAKAVEDNLNETAVIPIPMRLDPSLCTGESISPYMPGEDIAFEGGQVTSDDFTFYFYLTCATTTENYTPGSQPIEKLGLFAFWVYNQPPQDLLSDSYGFSPPLYPVMNKAPVSDGVTTSSGASGIISVAKPGEMMPEGLFVLPNLDAPARFTIRLETTQGVWSAAVNFKLQATTEGYRPVDVWIEALPAEKAAQNTEKVSFFYPAQTNLDQAQACPVGSIGRIAQGKGEFYWPIPGVEAGEKDNRSVDQDFPGINVFAGTGQDFLVIEWDTGTVIFAGPLAVNKPFAVLIDHGNGYQTFYSNLSDIRVACGDVVEKGLVIGSARGVGEAQPYVHFEIYYQGLPINPLDKFPTTP